MEMIGTASRPLVIGTRASQLALTQTQLVAADLEQRGLKVEIRTFTTEGDTSRASLSRLGGVGVFAAALRVALLENQCDMVVHSMKDLPTVPVTGLTLACVPTRVNPVDVLVAKNGLSLEQLASGSRVGTGSPRRAAQILLAKPDIDIVDIRGNLPTRLGRVSGIVETAQQLGVELDMQGKPAAQDLDAIVVAAAGLQRLGWQDLATQDLSKTILPAAGQGALALETREEIATDEHYKVLYQILRIVDDLPSRLETSAERALMRYLEAGCAAPLGARATLTWDKSSGAAPSGKLELNAKVVSESKQFVEVNGETTVLLGAGPEERDFAITAAQQLGVDLAQELLEAGGGDITNLRAMKPADEHSELVDSGEQNANEKLRWGEF